MAQQVQVFTERDTPSAKKFAGFDCSRALFAGMAAFAAAQVALTAMHLPAWPCPFHSLTGIPCPGCGLSRATAACLTGRWADSLRLHAFGVLVPPLVLLAAICAVLPAHKRVALIDKIMVVQHRHHIGIAIVILLLGHWVLRLAGVLPLPPG